MTSSNLRQKDIASILSAYKSSYMEGKLVQHLSPGPENSSDYELVALLTARVLWHIPGVGRVRKPYHRLASSLIDQARQLGATHLFELDSFKLARGYKFVRGYIGCGKAYRIKS